MTREAQFVTPIFEKIKMSINKCGDVSTYARNTNYRFVFRRSTIWFFSFLLSSLSQTFSLIFHIGIMTSKSTSSLLSRRSSSSILKPELKRERVFSILSGGGRSGNGEEGSIVKNVRPSLLRRSTTLSGHPKKESIETKILEKSDPRLFKDLPELPTSIQQVHEENTNDDDVIIKEENEIETKLERKPRLRKVLSSPNRLSLLRPSPLKLNKFPDWLSGNNTRSPSNKSISPLSDLSTTITEPHSNEEKTRLTRKKSFNLLSPSDWLKSPSIASFKNNKSMEHSPIVPVEQFPNTEDEILSLAEELDLFHPQSSRTSFHTTQESIIGTIPDTKKPRETNDEDSGETQWSQESAKEMNVTQSEERNEIHELDQNLKSDNTIDQDNFKTLLADSLKNAAIEEAWTAFNVSPNSDETKTKFEFDQSTFPISVDTLTSYDRSRCTPDVCEGQQFLTVAKPSFLRSISERTASSFGDFYSANSSMTELGETQRSTTAKLSEGVEYKASESVTDLSRMPSSMSPTFSAHSPISKNSIPNTSIPSTPTSFTSTSLSSPDAKIKRFSPVVDLSEFCTQSYWSEDSEEEQEENKKEKKVRNKRKFNTKENPRDSQIGKRLGLIFDHSIYQPSPTISHRKSFSKRKNNTYERDSPQFDSESSFLDINNTVNSPRKPSRLLMGLTYVPQLLRHKGSTSDLGGSPAIATTTITPTEMQRSKSANDLASSYQQISTKTPSPIQTQGSDLKQIRNLSSITNYPLLMSPITIQPQSQSPTRSNRLSHKPSLPALLEGRTLTNDSHVSKLKQQFLDQNTISHSQTAKRSSWHPFSSSQQPSQFRDNIVINGWTIERE